LKNAATATETCATEFNGNYSSCTTPTSYGYVATTNVAVTVAGTTSDYCVTAVHGLLGADQWASATYDSDEGTPQSDDTC
jgi:hypothetical protein